MNSTPYTIFISDLHLEAKRIDLTQLFLSFMTQHHSAESIYILGDFFNAFIGEDDQSAYIEQIKHSCRQYTHQGGQLFIMCGNRDFLMQHQFAASVGAQWIKDPTIIHLYGLKLLLTHGDYLCTDDVKHQQWRQIYNKPWSYRLAHTLPLQLRLWLAKSLRSKSKKRKANCKNKAIMDVNSKAVLKALTDSKCDYLIHGHTHRPADHGPRLVLGAWPDDNAVIQINADQSIIRLNLV